MARRPRGAGPQSATWRPFGRRVDEAAGSGSGFERRCHKLQRSDAGEPQPHACVVTADDREEGVVTVRAAKKETSPAEDVNGPDRLSRAAVPTSSDCGRHLRGKHLLE